jgi:hypothetical protein
MDFAGPNQADRAYGAFAAGGALSMDATVKPLVRTVRKTDIP